MRTFQRLFRRLRLEQLEDRRLLALDPTGQEQEFLEAINRMRINPAGELGVIFTNVSTLTSSDPAVTSAVRSYGINSAQLQAAFAALTPVAPVALSEPLSTSAGNHDAAMISANTQAHQLPGEPSLSGRAVSAGYSTWTGLGENVFAYASSVFYGHAGFAVDWGNNPPGHRTNLMEPGWQEVGVDVTATVNPNPAPGNVGPLVVTQDFGSRSDYGTAQLLGVVFTDSNGSTRYNAGEGRGGVTITAAPVGGGTSIVTTTMTAGGYQMHVPAGTYNVTASGGSLSSPLTFTNIVVGASNRKLDFITNIAPNVAPTNTVPGTQGVITNSTLTFSTANGNRLAVADPDAGNNPLQVTLSVSAGALTLSGANGLSFTAGNGNYSTLMTFTGTATAINTALAGLRFTPPSIAATVAFTITTNDLGNSGAGGPLIDTDSVTINVTPPPNAPPVNTVPGAQITQTNVPVTFSTSRGNPISIADPDAGSLPLRFTIAATNGTVSLGQVGNLSFSVGSTLMTFDAPLLSANAGIANLVFTPSPGFTGTGTVTITTNDLGNTGTGGAKTDTDAISIVVADPIVVSGNTVTLSGTTEPDSVAIQFTSPTTFNLTLGGTTGSYSTSSVSNIRFALGGSNDTVSVNLPANGKTIYITPEILNITGPGYTIYGTGGNAQQVYGNGGGGTAQFFDSPGNDTFYGLGPSASLGGTGFFNQVSGLTTYYASSINGGSDTAFLSDSPGNDNFYGLPTTSIISGGGQFIQAVNYRTVYANATHGGVDVAQIYDTSANDTYYLFPTYGLIVAPNYLAQAQGFAAFYAMATSGGTDTAVMYDSAGADTFTGTSTTGILVGTNYSNIAYQIEYLYVLGYAGGNNVANVYDSSGNDYLTASGKQFNLYYPTGGIFLGYFTSVNAVSSSGGTDNRTRSAIDYALTTTGNWVG